MYKFNDGLGEYCIKWEGIKKKGVIERPGFIYGRAL